jgi:N,N'-diacetyllegionaminate synthase
MTASNRITMIAEIGSNYDGQLDEAKRYIEASAKAGADVAKFQTLTRDGLVARMALDRASDEWVANPRYAGFTNHGLPDDWHYKLKACADDNGIEFMSTPFHLEAVDMLVDVGVSRFKIASGDLTFTPLLEKVAKTGKAVVLSTGASYLDEVRTAVATLKNAGCTDLTVLHCTASYPPSWNDMNLNAVASLKSELGLPVGLSDHSPGHIAPIAAAALGATLIENNDGPDHPFAIEMDELASLVTDLRNLEIALGSAEKIPAGSEIARRGNLRRGLYDRETGLPTTGDGVWLRPDYEELARTGK